MTPRHGSGGRLPIPRRVAALLDQGLISGANFVGFLLFARHAAPEIWGEFGFAYSMVLFIQGFQRAAVTIPMIPFSARNEGWLATRHQWERLNLAVAWLGATCLLVVAAIAAGAGAQWLARSGLLAAAMAVPMMIQEFARRGAIQEERFGTLVGAASAYALCLVAGGLTSADVGLGAWLPALAVAAGSLAAAAVVHGAGGRWPLLLPRMAIVAAGHPHFVRWASLSHLGFSGYNFGVQMLLGALAGPAAVGVFHACRTFIQPVVALIGAMDSVDKPKAASALAAQGPPGLRRVILRSLLAIALLGLPYLLGIAIGAEFVLELAYGARYLGSDTAVILWCVVAAGMIVAQPVESGLYVAERTKQMFFCRAVAASVSLVAAVPLIQAWGVDGALLSIAFGFFATAAAGAVILRRLQLA